MNRVLLLGMGPTAPSALSSLVGSFEVVGVMRNVGPGDEVQARATALSVPILTDVSVQSVRRAVAELRPDCTVVSSYDRILDHELLAQTRFVNVHYAPLPEYRGRANVNWAIINGEDHAGITIHTIAPGLDAGNILFQERVPIDADATVADLYEALNDIQEHALAEVVARHIAGYAGEPQDERLATYGCTRVPQDGQIDWTESTDQIYALVRALARPYPPAYTHLGTRPISIIRATPLRDPDRYVGRVPGRVVSSSRTQGHVDVLTGDGVLRLHQVAEEGSPATAAATIITSTRQTLGLRTSDLLARIAALEEQVERLRSPDRGAPASH